MQLTAHANGAAERFVRTVRAACLDGLLVLTPEPLEHVLRVFLDHDNGHRPHRALALPPPQPIRPPVPGWSGARVQCRERLGGVIHEYALAA
ncbi:MAG: integrase core domain-containing protein [Vicinamibacteraceae bacterium]